MPNAAALGCRSLVNGATGSATRIPGYSNSDITKTLFISVATMQKHMENVFNRTGVRTRSAAAALALPYAGPSPGTPISRRSDG